MPNRDRHPAGTPAWVEMAARDGEAAREFYSGLFGWTWEQAPGPEGGMRYFYGMLDGRKAAGLYQIVPEMGDMMPVSWTTYLFTDSAERAHAAAEEAGATTYMGPMDAFGAGEMAYMADDQGASFIMWEPKNHQGAQVVNEPGAHTWAELIAPDLERAADFYDKVFGLKAVPAPDMKDVVYKLWMAGEAMVGGLMAPPFPAAPTCWFPYFGTADAQESGDRATGLGGEVIMGPAPTPAGDITVIQDPQGAMFSVIQLNEWPTD